MQSRRYSDAEIRNLTEEAINDGFCILRGHIQNRGAERYYVTLPFDRPFADEEVFCDPDVLAIVENLVGAEFTMVQLATDTPLRGSDYQDVHRDAPPLFPEWGQEPPAFQLAVNFPLIDVTPENGPFEVARGTHRVAKEEGMRMIENGERPLEPVFLAAGDVMIRDVRGLHRGTPNRTDTPRPMVVVGYSRKWLLRPEVSIRIPRSVWEGLSERSRHMLRFNPVVESLDNPTEEVYRSFAY